MRTYYFQIAEAPVDNPAELDLPGQMVVVIPNRDAAYVVPRWLAEACQFELEHEHDTDPDEHSELVSRSTNRYPATVKLGNPNIKAGGW